MKKPATLDERDRKSPAKLFISYSRKDQSFAERLSAAMHASGYDVWVDLKGIRPSEDWLNAVYSAIEGADVFVFVVSPDSVDPLSICAREIQRAVGHHKRIVPVAYRSIDTRTVPVPESIRRLNWISCLETQEFDLCVSILKEAIETDLEWAKAHTRMLVRAVEWDDAKRDDSYLLQKNDLALAEQWLALGPEREPRPTTLQTEYIVQSRTNATRRQRRLTVIGFVAVLLVGIGGTTAVYESRQAGTRRKEAISRQLSAEAQFELGRRLDRAILLTSQAFSILPLQEVLSSAVTVGQAAARVQKILRGHTNRIAAMCFLPNNRLLVSADDGGRVILWDTDSGSPLQLLSSSSIAGVACSSVTPVVAVVEGGTVILWRVDGDRATRSVTIVDDIAQIQFSQNGLNIVTVGETVKVRSARTGEVVGSTISGSYVTVSAVSDSGDLVAIGTAGGEHDEHGGEVLVWRGGKQIFSNALSAIGVKTVIVDSKREKVLAVGDGSEVKTWKFDGTTEEKKIPENLDIRPTKTAAFDAGGDLVAIGQGRAAFLCEVTTQNMECNAHFAGHASAVSAVALSPSKSLAATGSEDGMIIVHRLLSKDAFEGGWAVEGNMGGGDKLEFSTDGTALILRNSSKVLQRVPLPEEIIANSGSASRSSKPSVNFLAPRISVVVQNDRARLMDQDRKRELGQMTPEPGKQVTGACTTPDGRRWAAIAKDSVRIANIRENRTYQGVVPSGFGNITSVAISPDGALLAVAGSNLLEAFDGSAGSQETALTPLVYHRDPTQPELRRVFDDPDCGEAGGCSGHYEVKMYFACSITCQDNAECYQDAGESFYGEGCLRCYNATCVYSHNCRLDQFCPNY